MTYFRFLANLFLPTVVSATTIVGVVPASVDPAQGYTASGVVETLSWTSSLGYTHVNVSADLGVVSCCMGAWSFTGVAYLTNSIGPTTTAANVLATQPLTLSGSSSTSQDFGPYPTLLFHDLTLAPGTYDVVLTFSDADPDMRKVTLLHSDFFDPGYAVIGGPGISGIRNLYAEPGAGTVNASFAPSSTFIEQPIVDFQINVVGNPVPEPMSTLLVEVGLLAIAFRFFGVRVL